jgi:hypothetical protein
MCTVPAALAAASPASRTGSRPRRRAEDREVRVAGQQPAAAVAHCEPGRVDVAGTQHLFGFARQVDAHRRPVVAQARGQCAGGVEQSLVEGQLGRRPCQQVGERGGGQVEQHQRPHQRFQQAQPDAAHASASRR